MSTVSQESIHVEKLELEPAYQRPLEMSKVNKWDANFNPRALGIITVSRRTNHGIVVIDGQHRRELVRRKALNGDHDGFVDCHVFEGLTLAEEAQMYLELNAGSQPTPLQKFKARLTAQEPSAVEIDKSLRYYGWAVRPETGDGTIQAVVALDKVYALSQKVQAEPNLVQMVILTIQRAWGMDREAGTGALLLGLGQVFAEYGERIDLDNLINKLHDFKGGPSTLLNNARQLATLQNWKLASTIAAIIVDEYNKNRRIESSRLPAWRRRT
jgi:hypothetical protein